VKFKILEEYGRTAEHNPFQ